jgi:hypothetical protein
VLGERGTFVEVKRGGRGATQGIRRAATVLGVGGIGWIVERSGPVNRVVGVDGEGIMINRVGAAEWLYAQAGAAGGTLLEVAGAGRGRFGYREIPSQM